MSLNAVTAIAQAAARLDEAARAAKDMEARQRRQAKRLRQAYDLLHEACAVLGIDLSIERPYDDDTDPEEESQSWQRTHSSSAA